MEVYDELEKALKEIERLKEELKYTVPVVEYNKTITKHIKEKEQLHSIIKEVREYIKDIQNSMWHDDKEVLKTILEILDKEKK